MAYYGRAACACQVGSRRCCVRRVAYAEEIALKTADDVAESTEIFVGGHPIGDSTLYEELAATRGGSSVSEIGSLLVRGPSDVHPNENQ